MATAPITAPTMARRLPTPASTSANSDEPGVIIWRVCRHETGEAKDVLFILPGERKARRFVIWHDGDAIYGEW